MVVPGDPTDCGGDRMTIEVTQQVNEIVVTAVADPTVRVVLEHVTGSAGGSGDGNVIGPDSSIDGRPVGFDGTTGRKIKQLPVNAPNGLARLNESGTLPDPVIGSNVVRTGELNDAIATHTAAPDPHGDRAYADPRGMAVAASAPNGGPVAMFHSFAAGAEGLIDEQPTTGTGTHDPDIWYDARTQRGEDMDIVLEECHVVDGVLRHRGTRLVAAAYVMLPAGESHAVTMGYTASSPGPGGGFPTLGVPESGYSASRISFIDGDTSDGYVGYVQSDDEHSNHTFLIVRDTATIPTPIAGPWDIGRRLNEHDCWTFRHDGNTFSIILNGEVVGSVVDNTYHWSTFYSSSIVLNTGSLWLPGVPWWSLALVGHTGQAHSERYVPGEPDDWEGTPPATTAAALDELAGRSVLITDLATLETDTAMVLHPDGDGGVAWGAAPASFRNPGWVRRSLATVAESISALVATSTQALTSGRLALSLPMVVSPAIGTVNYLSFLAGPTAGSGMTNQWFCVVNASTREVLAVTVDDGATAWASSALKTLALTAAWTPSTELEVQLGVMVAGTTPPNLRAAAPPQNSGSMGLNTNNTGLTTPLTVGTVLATGGANINPTLGHMWSTI